MEELRKQYRISKSYAEIEEEIAGITGAQCPFCNHKKPRIIIDRDRRGIYLATWECENCNESGPCLADGTLYWNPES